MNITDTAQVKTADVSAPVDPFATNTFAPVTDGPIPAQQTYEPQHAAAEVEEPEPATVVPVEANNVETDDLDDYEMI